MNSSRVAMLALAYEWRTLATRLSSALISTRFQPGERKGRATFPNRFNGFSPASGPGRHHQAVSRSSAFPEAVGVDGKRHAALLVRGYPHDLLLGEPFRPIDYLESVVDRLPHL